MTQSLAAALFVILMGTGGASAEAPTKLAAPPVSAPSPSPSVFAHLSPGNRRTATALFEAQKASLASVQRLTLDQIARERLSGKSWSDIFQVMKSQGLIDAETLAQLLGRHDRARHSRI